MAAKLTRQQRALCGVMCVAALAFLADHFVIRPGEAGAASAADEYAVSRDGTAASVQPRASAGPTVAATSNSSRLPATPEDRLAARLRELAAAKAAVPPRDPFAPAPITTAAAVVPPVPGNDSEPADLRTYRLEAVLAGAGRSGAAIVDGKVIRVGGRLDGLELLRVMPGAAVFGDGSRSLILRMSDAR